MEQAVGEETDMLEAIGALRRDGRRCLLNWM